MIMANIYVASSWRNDYQPKVVSVLRSAGHAVYDFKNPSPGDNGFHWSEIDPNWKGWSPDEFREGLDHPLAKKGYGKDRNAMVWANAGLLVLPSGLSAHLEAGWLSGRGKPTAVFAPEIKEPELMYKLMEESFIGDSSIGKWFCTTIDEVMEYFHSIDKFLGIVR